jgi:dTDP-4-dehydrorhamnose 3,5-epimerase
LFGDPRGCLFESWNQRRWSSALQAHGQEPVPFVQENHSCSRRGVLRGLHYQLPPHAQAKLVRCIQGEIFDVAVDLRPGSATCGRWIGVVLSAANRQQLWLPAGFAHGFLCLSETAEVLYRATAFWHRASERALRWDDPALAIDWPLARLAGARPLLSPKDAQAPLLVEAGELLPLRL